MTCGRSSENSTLRDTLTETSDHPVLVAAVRYGLGSPIPPVVLDASAAEAVFAHARFHHLSGFLATAVAAGVVVGDNDNLWSALRRQWHDELLMCVRLEALAVRTGELLDAGGIRWRLTKGAALAYLDYPVPAIRTFGDIDLVIHPADWSTAFGLLSANGYHRETPTLPGNYDDRYGKGATLTTVDALEVDLHRRFAIGRFGVTVRTEAVFASSDTIHLAGRTIPVFDPPGRLLHACFHAALGGFPGLRAFRDVAQLILVTGADWKATFDIARQWRAEAVVASAITQSWDRLELGADHPAHARAASTSMSPADRRVLQMFAANASFRSQAMSAVRRLPAYEVPRYLWSLGRPKLRRTT